jgi:hypothetical protein
MESKNERINLKNILLIIFAFSTVLLLLDKFGIFTSFFVLSSNDIGKKVIDFINNNLVEPGTYAKLISVRDMGSYYEILTEYQGNKIPVYVSKDGKVLFLQAIEITETKKIQKTQNVQEIPKKERPQVELYIFSYCPYGVYTLHSFAIVGKLLGNKAEMKVKFFSDMHGEHELQQNMIQECIQEVESSKYWDYAIKFQESVYSKCARSRDVNCDKNESIALMKEIGIDVDKVMKCVKERGKELYNRDVNDANKYGLTGSPSLVINGVKVIRFDRSPEGLKRLICSSFVNPPDECSQTLPSSSSGPAGSC